MSRVCVAITGDTAEEMLTKADGVVRENPFLEFRLDYLQDPEAAISKLEEFLYERSEVTAVATCRRTTGGGRFRAPAVAQLDILTAAANAGFHLVDLEIETAETISREQFEALRTTLAAKGTGLILSSHDFEATGDLDKTFARLQSFQPDFIKIVSTAKSLTDNVTMMHFLERKSDGANLIGICMGDQGLVSRVLGVRAGSIFTFASATEGEETGPGQIAARTLLETYRIEQVEPSTRVYGVAGSPIRHSLSPLMQNTAFRRETVNAVFLALEAKKLSDLLNLVRELPVAGLAVTMPFKQEILAHLQKTDPLSAKIGACNTVVRAQDGRLFGFNTDVGGITRPIERRMPIRGTRILVLGAGGAARAAVFGLVDKGAEVFILNRTIETAQKLARQAKAKTIRRDQVAKVQFDVIVNATPAGMAGQKVASILEPHELNARLVFDTVYNPLETPLLRTARERGIAIISGVEMFVQQGARQFEIWTGKPAPEDEMMRVVLHALKRRADAQSGGNGLARVAQVIPISVPRSSSVSVAAPAESTALPETSRPTEPQLTGTRHAETLLTDKLPPPVLFKQPAPSSNIAVPTPATHLKAVNPANKAGLHTLPVKVAAGAKQAAPAATAVKAARPTGLSQTTTGKTTGMGRPAAGKGIAGKSVESKTAGSRSAAGKSGAGAAIVRTAKTAPDAGAAGQTNRHASGKPHAGAQTRAKSQAKPQTRSNAAGSNATRGSKTSSAAGGGKPAPSKNAPRGKR